MTFFNRIRPKQPLKELKWFDIGIVTAILFGQFIIRSTQLFLASFQPVAQTAVATSSSNTASEGAAYSSNMTLQLILLALALLYLLLRRFDFKQLPIRFKWSILIWVPLLFAAMGLFGDVISTVSGEYNYLSPSLWPFIDLMQILHKFMALSPMAIAYGLLNGFYEEFFFLGLMTSVSEKNKWKALAFSTLIRFSFHTYQGLLWAFVIGVIYGLFYYVMYKKVVKNLLPFFLMHALADMFGSSLMYLLINWGSLSYKILGKALSSVDRPFFECYSKIVSAYLVRRTR